MASSASRYYSKGKGHFCEEYLTEFNDVECVYDRDTRAKPGIILAMHCK